MSIGAISAITSISGIGNIGSIGSIGSTGSIGSIGSVGTIANTGAVDGTAVGTQAPGSSFLNSLSDSIGQLNTQMTSADAAMSDFASGGSADLHTVMLQMDEASLSLKTATTVRDKVLEAYQEIMRTQL
jgi:flagellar hook-basal body complex protein FliE